MGHHPVEDSNRSGNEDIQQVLDRSLSRRQVLRGSAVVATAVAGSSLVACGSDSNGGGAGITVAPKSLGFTPVAKSLEDRVTLPEGYQASVLIAKGDPLALGVASFKNDGSDVDYDQRSGDEHDGMHYFGLSASGSYDPAAASRGLLCMNHENLEDGTLHPNGPTAAEDNGGARPKVEVDREIQAHGVAIVEVRKEGAQWSYVQGSPFNRRITGATEMIISGPLAGSDRLKTRLSPDGITAYGTLNNCANGFTPWGTYLTCEENWFSYFNRGDDAADRSDDENALFARYGMGPNSRGFSYREWDTVPAGDLYARFNITVSGDSAEEDFRNEPNLLGYVVEIDPFRPASKPKKRTAMGRFAHEGAWFAPARAGEPLVYYMGDDSRGEYLYKFVSAANWDPADADLGLAAGDKYLDAGTLYVASFSDTGTGEWLPLVFGQNGLNASNPLFAFANQGDVLLATRLAADHVGATKMDRPEWTTVNPLNGEAYLALTNNRTSVRPADETDAVNPRAYPNRNDARAGRGGNVNGHIIRWRESGGVQSATSFDWDIFLFGADADADPANVNISGLSADNDFSSPDGLLIDPRGVIWIQTDDGAITDRTNNQMLVAIPGQVGDGSMQTVNNDVDDVQSQVATFVGRDATATDLRRFLVGPSGCEITGIAITPDARALFINIQHPGEDGEGNWPNPNGDATALSDGVSRPRSATIVITRTNGGEIAL